MQLTIRATGPNVKILSYLLAKNPNNRYERSNNGHLVRMFFSEFSDDNVEVTFFVTPDSIEMSRNSSETYDITSYINDREFVVSSIFCTLIRSAIGTALNGKPKEEYASWVNHRFPFDIEFGPIASNLSDQEIVELFEPMGYKVRIAYGDADYQVKLKEKSTARYISLTGLVTLQNALRQLFVLIPVLDDYKHYYIDEKEVEKLQRYGEGWLENHSSRDFIMQKSIRFKELYSLVGMEEPLLPKGSKTRLNELRYQKIIEYIKCLPDKEKVVDLGAGEGKLSVQVGFVAGVKEILAVEPSEMERLKANKRFEEVDEKQNFITPTTMMGSLFYYDERLLGKDVMILCEVIEHIDQERLPKIMTTILQIYKPKALIITTPNKEYNQVYELEEAYRHNDHRFEWTRQEFKNWCNSQSRNVPYEVIFDGVGEEHERYGHPTQLCMFRRREEE